MGRWQPGTKDRLQVAALDLYVSRGFDQATVTEIAASVGVTERTFFRHFADKREVLFDGQEQLAAEFVRGVVQAPAAATPFELVEASLAAAAAWFPDDRRGFARRRQQVIGTHPALQEREQLKLAGLASTIAAALRQRGVSEPTASIAAQSGVTVFEVAFTQWIADGESRALTEVEAAGLRALRELVR